MPNLKLIQWVLLCLLADIEFTACQNLTILAYFGNIGAAASVVAADPSAATYLATYTINTCRPLPCLEPIFYTDIIVQGPSTAALTQLGGDENATIACVVTTALMTATCTFQQTYRSSVQTLVTTSASNLSFSSWGTITVTAGLDKLSGTSVATTNSGTSASATSTRTQSTSTPSASNTISNGGAASTTSLGSTAAKGRDMADNP